MDTGAEIEGSLLAVPCHGRRGNQGFMFTNDHQMRSGRFCFAAVFAGKSVRKVHCLDENEGVNEQYWTYDKEVGVI